MPTSVTTTISTTNIIISWSPVYNGGSAITAYNILIRASDGVSYYANSMYCASTSPSIISEAKCTLPISEIRATPYNLEWGSSVFAKVSATNLVGDSSYSTSGNGAVLITTPDAPINLANNPDISTMT